MKAFEALARTFSWLSASDAVSPAARIAAAVMAAAVLGGGVVAYEALSPPRDVSRPDAVRPAPSRAVAESAPASPTTDAEKLADQHSGGQDCTVCHVTRHPERTPCTECHEAGTTWAVAHPKDTDCSSCHDAPHASRGECSTCHRAESWRPTSGAVDHDNVSRCTDCHSVGHRDRGARCANCHRPGVSWAFKHPASKKCSACHKAPGGHYGTTCSNCHSARKAWRSAAASGVRHTSSLPCLECHKTKHPGRGKCATCHRPGVSWAFRHPSSSSCSSCHKAPGSHYGSSCASCHSPGKKWSSASFSHPRVPGGEHTYRSWSCASCHPSGYGSTDCKTCHEQRGEGDDDD